MSDSIKKIREKYRHLCFIIVLSEPGRETGSVMLRERIIVYFDSVGVHGGVSVRRLICATIHTRLYYV